jgi:hypothetical protein
MSSMYDMYKICHIYERIFAWMQILYIICENNILGIEPVTLMVIRIYCMRYISMQLPYNRHHDVTCGTACCTSIDL